MFVGDSLPPPPIGKTVIFIVEEMRPCWLKILPMLRPRLKKRGWYCYRSSEIYLPSGHSIHPKEGQVALVFGWNYIHSVAQVGRSQTNHWYCFITRPCWKWLV